MGVAGLIVPEEHGGAGMELLDLALVAEILGEFAIPGPFLGHALAIRGVLLAGSKDQRARILPDLAGGETIATVALQEGDAAWSPDAWTARVRGGRLTGEKTIVSHAALADRILVGLDGGEFAWVDAKSEGIVIEDLGGLTRSSASSSVSRSVSSRRSSTRSPGSAPTSSQRARSSGTRRTV